MDPSEYAPVSEALCLAQYPEFAEHASKAERAVLLAIARFRTSLLLEFKGNGSGRSFPTHNPNMFSQCASTLRQTGAWAKISLDEKERIERELLTLPTRK